MPVKKKPVTRRVVTGSSVVKRKPATKKQTMVMIAEEDLAKLAAKKPAKKPARTAKKKASTVTTMRVRKVTLASKRKTA